MPKSDTSTLTQDTIRFLQGLIRLDTTNPPGNEAIAAAHIAGILRERGVESVVIPTAPGRDNVVARLKGDGSQAPLLLYSHTDVVPVERDKWTVDPFGGEIRGDYLYGRGALDMKGIGAMQLAVFLAVAASGRTLKRDLILAATADEESDANLGIGPLTDAHPDLLRAEYALSEFGGFSMYVGGRCFYPVQTAEKGTAWLRMIARGRPGHASVPHDDNAVAHLARAVDKIARARMPMHMTATAREFILGLAEGLGGATGAALRTLSSAPIQEFALDHAVRDPGLAAELRAITHNTISPTGLRAGKQTNVIPSDATAILDCRTLPGFNAAGLIAELEHVLGEELRHVHFEIDSESPPVEFNFDTPLFELIRQKLKDHDPAGIPVPTMMTGATDAKHLIKLGTQCYGFSPMKFLPGDTFADLVHGHDERVSITSLGWGAQVLYDVVSGFCLT